MVYKVEREFSCVVDLTKFDRFYKYWHKWIEDHMEELTAREFLLAGSVLTAMDDFTDFILGDAAAITSEATESGECKND